MDQKILDEAAKAAQPVKKEQEKQDIINSPVREVMDGIIGGKPGEKTLTVVWDTHHYSEGVSSGIELVEEVLLAANGGKGKKLIGVEAWDEKQQYDQYIQTGDKKYLPDFLHGDREGMYGTIGEMRRSLQRAHKANSEENEIHYLAYDDRSQIYASEEETELLPELEKLAETNPKEFDREYENRLVAGRNVLMAQKLVTHMKERPYTHVVIPIGSGHVEELPGKENPKGDFDEMVAAALEPMGFQVKNMAIIYNRTEPPGIYQGSTVKVFNEWIDGAHESVSNDRPDVVINYLPYVTPEQFDARVQSVPYQTRKTIVADLKPWQDKMNAFDNDYAKHVAGAFKLEPKVDAFMAEFRNVRSKMTAWDFEGAEQQGKTLQEKYAPGSEGRKELLSEMVTQYKKQLGLLKLLDPKAKIPTDEAIGLAMEEKLKSFDQVIADGVQVSQSAQQSIAEGKTVQNPEPPALKPKSMTR